MLGNKKQTAIILNHARQ